MLSWPDFTNIDGQFSSTYPYFKTHVCVCDNQLICKRQHAPPTCKTKTKQNNKKELHSNYCQSIPQKPSEGLFCTVAEHSIWFRNNCIMILSGNDSMIYLQLYDVNNWRVSEERTHCTQWRHIHAIVDQYLCCHIWLHIQKHWSTMAQMVACCLTAPRHYLNQHVNLRLGLLEKCFYFLYRLHDM